LKNAVSALPTVTTTIRELKDASLAESSLSLKKALLNAAALVLSAPTLLRMPLAVAALVTSSRMRPVKSSEMFLTPATVLERPSTIVI